MTDDDRRARGVARFQELFGVEPPVASLEPAFVSVTLEHLFGEIWTRPGLALAERSLVTLAALTVLGREQELRLHLRGARNVGIPREKLVELMIHLAHYGGWPVAVAGLRALQEAWPAAPPP